MAKDPVGILSGLAHCIVIDADRLRLGFVNPPAVKDQRYDAFEQLDRIETLVKAMRLLMRK